MSMGHQQKTVFAEWDNDSFRGPADFSTFDRTSYGVDTQTATYGSVRTPFQGSTSTVTIPSTNTAASQPRQTLISDAIADHTGSSSPTFALIYLDSSGEYQYDSSPNLQRKLPEIFDNRFVRRFTTISSGLSQTHRDSASNKRIKAFKNGRDNVRQVASPIHSSQVSSTQPRSRKRRALVAHPPTNDYDSDSFEDDMEDGSPVNEQRQTIKHQSIKIGDHAACIEFYKQRFVLIQQVPCKMIAKEWIKAIEPKKQTKYPYNGGKKAKEARDEWEANGKVGAWDSDQDGSYSKPPWWPTEVKHKEPDHIKKKDRLSLLIHLLTQLYETHNVRVAQLRQSTTKTVAGFGDVKGGPGAQVLKKYLDDIYHLRDKEEQYLEGGIDATAVYTFPQPVIEPRRPPRRPYALFPGKDRYTEDFSDAEDSDEDGHKPEVETPTSLASPVGKLEINASSAQRDEFPDTSISQRYYPSIQSAVGPQGDPSLFDHPELELKFPQSAPPAQADSSIMAGEMDFYLNNNRPTHFQTTASGSDQPLQQAPLMKTTSSSQGVQPLGHPETPVRHGLQYRNNSVPNLPPRQFTHESWSQPTAFAPQSQPIVDYEIASPEEPDLAPGPLGLPNIQQQAELMGSFSSNDSNADYPMVMPPPFPTGQSSRLASAHGFPSGIPSSRQSFG